MDMLSNILGGQKQQEFDDFANRYDQGAPWDGISDDEAMNRYSQVAPQLPPDVYQRSAQESFSRLTPDQRMQLGRHIQQRAPEFGVSFPDRDMNGQDDRLQDPAYLAQMTGQIHQQQPGLLAQILGGAGAGSQGSSLGGGMLANPIAKAALGGIAAMAVRHVMGARR
jgi:hypothetical protein